MDPRDPKFADFLATVQADHGEDVRRTCEEIIEDLPRGSDAHPFNILSKAQVRMQESELEDLAAMNASPFDSARD